MKYIDAIETFLWIVVTLIIAYLIWCIYRDKSYFETFETSTDVSAKIIKIYYENLKRAPSTDELRAHTTAVFNKTYDYNEVELRIINSDEYQRLVKTQSDTIQPETARVLEEKDLVARVKRVYERVREKECPQEMFLPLKDLYIHFNYNVYKFVAMLRDTKYIEFETIVKTSPNLSRESLIELYLATFDDAKLNYDASAIEEMDMTLPEGTRFADLLLSPEPMSKDDANKVNAMGMLAYLMKNIKEEDDKKKAAEEEERIKRLREASEALKRERALTAKSLSSTSTTSCTATRRIYLPDEAKVVDSGYGFPMTQTLPPICIPVGKPNEMAEVVLYRNLQGTPIGEDTQVGSIMPKFEYRRYIEIDTAGTTEPPPPSVS